MIDLKDKVIKEIKPKNIRRVISEKTSRQMMEILKSVVKDGTGKKAAIEGFDVARLAASRLVCKSVPVSIM